MEQNITDYNKKSYLYDIISIWHTKWYVLVKGELI